MRGMIGGRFELEEQVGAGGMARVFRARDVTTGEVVAVKVLNHATPEVCTRFEREVGILGDVVHPSVVRYVAHGLVDADAPYLAMEWLDGQDLEHYLRDNKPDVDQAVDMARAIASALAALHTRGVVHRDVKPGNIFLVGGDPRRPKLLDFGMARHEAQATLTQTGAIVGTPLYMAPEQASGRRDIDARADVFSLGAVLYTCLADRPPFVANNVVALLAKIVLEQPPELTALNPAVPAAVARAVGDMMAKSPVDRPGDAAAVRELLADIEVDVAAGRASRDRLSPLVEQRVVCVVLARGLDEVDVALDSTLASTGGNNHRLADGTHVTVFAGPESPSDLASRAVTHALGLSGDALRVVVASGRAVVSGPVPMGETIDTAAGLLEHAAVGSVALCRGTAGLVEGRFEVVEGDGDAVLVRGGRAGATRTLLGKRTRFFGRKRELAALEGYYAECAEERVTAAVLVIGPAGIGKTRLAHELCERLAEDEPPPQVLWARAESVSAGSPFAMVAAAINARAGVTARDDVVARRTKIAERIASGDDAEFLCAATGLPPGPAPSDAMVAALQSPAQMFERIRGGWLAWLERLCATAPVVIVAEDLHWGDQPSVQLLDAALNRLRDQPLLVLALARAEVHQRFPGLWRDNADELRLDPLRSKVSEKFVREVSGDQLGDSAIRHIVERAQGNAFFLEELIRSAAAGELSQLPDGIVGVVQLRLDGLSADARLVLRAAAVYGERFDPDAVAALVGARVDVDQAIDELIAAELLDRQPRSAAYRYSFRHALVRDAAYQLFTDDERQLAHGLAAAHLESSEAAEALVIAEHYDAAGNADKAAHWFRMAALAALASNDLAGAAAHVQRGQECVTDPAERARLAIVAAETMMWQSDVAGAFETCTAAVGDLEPGSVEWLRTTGLLITMAGQLGMNDRVVDRLERVLDLEPPDGGVEPFVLALARGASQLVWAHHIDLVRRALARIGEVTGGRTVSAHVQARILYARAYEALYDGNLTGCARQLEEAGACYDRIGFTRDAVQAEMLGCLFRVLGSISIDADVEKLRVLMARAAELEADYLAHWTRFELALALSLSGRRAEAEAELAQVSDKVKRAPLFAGSAAVWLSYAAMAEGDVDGVVRHMDAVSDLTVPDRYRAALEACAAWLALKRGDPAAARRQALVARESLEKIEGMRADIYVAGFTIVARVLLAVDADAAHELIRTHAARLRDVAANIDEPEAAERYLRQLHWNRDFFDLCAQAGLDT